MKKTLLEVIVVLLAVLLLEEGYAVDHGWAILVFPISIVGIAIAIKLIAFDH